MGGGGGGGGGVGRGRGRQDHRKRRRERRGHPSRAGGERVPEVEVAGRRFVPGQDQRGDRAADSGERRQLSHAKLHPRASSSSASVRAAFIALPSVIASLVDPTTPSTVVHPIPRDPP